MKNLQDIIQEKLQIGSKTKVSSYKYHPKDGDELRKLIEQLLDKGERGEDADLNDIDTSKITDMSYLFYNLDPHNINISKWNVSNVTNMCEMFSFCKNFNSDLSKWDVSKVKNMTNMFIGSTLEKNTPKWYK